ncbi:T9SS type A sorting domain-containing protein [bacterium]|nr:T9SS type A sorting domain-containing protein [bacterium]
MFRYDLTDTSSIIETTNPILSLNLSVWPNPFNSCTNIKFTLKESSSVKTSIYNLIGERVCDLTNDKLSAGIHTLQWNAEDLPSGVYFCKLKAGKHQEVKKLLLMR